MNWMKHGILMAISLVLTIVSRLYMLHLKLPAVTAVRPELNDVGFWTGLFSGRGMEYLWLHYPNEMTVFGAIFLFLALELAWLMET